MEMVRLPQSMYYMVAKAGRNGDQKWLPLWMHSKDTAGVMAYLIKEWIPESVVELLRQSFVQEKRANRCDIERLGSFLGYIHDFGKANSYFQCLITKNIPERLTRIKEYGISVLSWERYEKKGCNHAYISEALLRKYGCSRGIASIVGSHHGMTQEINKNKIKSLFSASSNLKVNLYGNDEEKWKNLRSAFLKWSLAEVGYMDIDEIPRISETGQILMTGLLIMADWISSNETYFPLLSLSEEGDEREYPFRVKQAMDKLHLFKPWDSNISYMDESVFEAYFGFWPRPAQMDFIYSIQELSDMETQSPGIFILEAPMGMGKTEAALAGAQLLANKTLAGGIFFGLPTQATANSIFERLLPWAEKQAQDEALGLSIRLAHAMSNFDALYQKMLEGDSQFDDDEDAEENRLYAHTWFSGKKQALLADFVVGTVDQLLMAALKKKHVMLRHLGMAGKVVIIDECHAYDVYTSEYLDRTLTWIGMYKQPVIILSATLPAHRRREMIAAYLNKDLEDIPKEIEKRMAYPLLTYSAGQEIMQKELRSDSRQTEIEIEDLQADKLAEFLKEELKNGGCAAVLLNTVKRVQETARFLREYFTDKQILELHSRYIYPDKKEREEELIRRMGKKSTSKERDGFILVASQVAEQSLDFDADILITELCPVDFLLQRMGREHRHKEHDSMRPDNLSKPRCIILRDGGEAYSKGSKAVYEEYLLMRTQAILPKRICIPMDIPQMVQKVYSDDDCFCKEIDGYNEAKLTYMKMQRNKQAKAESYLLQKPEAEDDEFSLDLFLQNATRVDDKMAEASVRDGGASLEVLVLQKRNDQVAFLPWEDEHEMLDEHELPSQEKCMKIAKQRLRLPRTLCRGDRLPQVIKELEDLFEKRFMEWRKSPWINGELILLLDETFSATLGGVKLYYSKEDGLMEIVRQEETNGRNGV